MNEMTVYQGNLPANIEEIAHEVLIGRDKLNAIRSAVSAARKLNHPTWKAMQEEGREYGERILDYELMLKEYFASIPKATKGSGNNQYKTRSAEIDTGVDFSTPKSQVISNLGFTQKEAERIQQLTPEAVAEAKEKARRIGDIPTPLSRSLELRDTGAPKLAKTTLVWNLPKRHRCGVAGKVRTPVG